MTGNGDQRPGEFPGKVLHEPGFTAPGRSLEQQRDAFPKSGLCDRDFFAGRQIIGFLVNPMFVDPYSSFSHAMLLEKFLQLITTVSRPGKRRFFWQYHLVIAQ
jgi:hypothetical protein